MARLSFVLVTALFALALAPVEDAHGSSIMDFFVGRQTTTASNVPRVLRAKKVVKSTKKKTCPPGQVFSPAQTCTAGVNVTYCRYLESSSTFEDASFLIYGSPSAFWLPTIRDAVKPSPGAYAVTGDCAYILDNGCDVVRNFSCGSCCYFYPRSQTFLNTPCLTDVTQDCNITYVANSATCGQPPNDIVNSTICNTCNLPSS